MLGPAPGMPIHYDLHVWVAERNPAGAFTKWNPAFSDSVGSPVFALDQG